MEHQRWLLAKENTIERKHNSARFSCFSLPISCFTSTIFFLINLLWRGFNSSKIQTLYILNLKKRISKIYISWSLHKIPQILMTTVFMHASISLKISQQKTWYSKFLLYWLRVSLTLKGLVSIRSLYILKQTAFASFFKYVDLLEDLKD